MKISVYTSCFLCAIFFFGSCSKAGLYEQKSKSIDSLSGAINSIVKELEKIDTVVLQRTVTRYIWYKEFIQQNLNDTITKEEADNLQQFYKSGQNLQNFVESRKKILDRAVLINSQLTKLSEDINTKAINTEQLSDYSADEKNEARKLIETVYQQQKLYHSGLEEFKNSIKGVELLIRSRNKGELPTIIKDTVSL